MRLHRYGATGCLPTNASICSPPFSAVHKARVRTNPCLGTSEPNLGHDATRNKRFVDSILRRSPRLPHQIRRTNAPFVSAELPCPVAALHRACRGWNPLPQGVLQASHRWEVALPG